MENRRGWHDLPLKENSISGGEGGGGRGGASDKRQSPPSGHAGKTIREDPVG
jgi:hypothetical protein